MLKRQKNCQVSSLPAFLALKNYRYIPWKKRSFPRCSKKCHAMLHPGILNASDTAATRAIGSENKTDIKKFDIKLNFAWLGYL